MLHKTIIMYGFCAITFTSLQGWTFSEVVSDTTTTVSGWFSKQESQASSKEYPLSASGSITVNNINGSITITTWNKAACMVEAIKRGTPEEIKDTDFTVEIIENEAKITTQPSDQKSKAATIDYTLIVPRTAAVTVRTNSGSIEIHESSANLDLQTLIGSITVDQAPKNVRARAPHGSIVIEQRSLDRNGSIFAEAEKDITLVIPQTAQATISTTTMQGKITSDIFITLDPMTTRLDKDAYKRMQHQIRGVMGSGGIPITLETTKGNIAIVGS